MTFWIEDFDFWCFVFPVVLVLNMSLTTSQSQLQSVTSLLPVVHMELWSYQRGYLSAACHAEEAGRGDGRYDTLPGLKPRQPAPVTHEKKNTIVVHGSRSCVSIFLSVCACRFVDHWGSPAQLVTVSANLLACSLFECTNILCVCVWFRVSWMIYESPWVSENICPSFLQT